MRNRLQVIRIANRPSTNAASDGVDISMNVIAFCPAAAACSCRRNNDVAPSDGRISRPSADMSCPHSPVNLVTLQTIQSEQRNAEKNTQERARNLV